MEKLLRKNNKSQKKAKINFDLNKFKLKQQLIQKYTMSILLFNVLKILKIMINMFLLVIIKLCRRQN